MDARFLFLFAAVLLVNGIKGNLNAVDVDPSIQLLENTYGNSLSKNSECGGVITGPAGVINFNDYEYITSAECVWTIQVPKKEVIQVRLIHDDYDNNDCRDICSTITLFGLSGMRLKPAAEIKYGDRYVYNVTGGSLVQIVFTAARLWAGYQKGFSLTFEGTGPDVSEPTDGLTQFKIVKENEMGSPGSFVYATTNTTSKTNKQFFSFVIHPPVQKQIALTLEYFNAGQQTVAGSCSHPENVMSITEVGFEVEYPATRLRACNCDSVNKTTIYSQLPLVVSLVDVGYVNFALTWETTRKQNCHD